MRRKLKALYIVLALVLLMIVAITAGFGLAVWDTGSTVTEVYAMAFPKDRNVIIGEKQTIEIAEGSISDYGTEDIQSGNPDRPISELTDSLGNVSAGEATGNVKELSEAGGIKGLTAGDTNQPEEEKPEEAEAEKERKPLSITAEIAGIGTVVRAGDDSDAVINDLPVPTQVAETAQDIDPQADYPLPYTEVDTSYFDDALFIGDSRVAGLAMNSGTNATFYAVTSFQLYRYKTFKVVQTPNGKVPIFDVMPYDKFTKIYIKVGLNELGSVTDEPFLNAYTSLINDLRVMQPRAIIYIQAILPVTQVKSQTDRVHCNENITRRNENLKSFAELMKCYYVDVGPYFVDETGALKAETTADGIHMYSKYMPQWINALRQQAVVWPPEQ